MAYYILVSFPFKTKKSKNSTVKTTTAAAREDKKVEMEMPAARWPVPLWESSASPTP